MCGVGGDGRRTPLGGGRPVCPVGERGGAEGPGWVAAPLARACAYLSSSWRDLFLASPSRAGLVLGGTMAAECDSAARDRLRRAQRPRADARRGGGRTGGEKKFANKGWRAREQGRVCCESTTRMGVSEPAPAEIKVELARALSGYSGRRAGFGGRLTQCWSHSWAALGFNDPDLESSKSPESRPLPATAGARLTKSHPSRVM